jgi:hypothetical protein
MNLWNAGVKARIGAAGARRMLWSRASMPENAIWGDFGTRGCMPLDRE